MSRSHPRPGISEVAGAAAVAAFATFALLAAFDARTDGRRVAAGVPAAEALIDQWEQHRRATWSVTTEATREGPSGARLAEEGRRVQRPPDELLVGRTGSELRADDEVRTCVAPGDGDVRCGPPDAIPSYEARLATELDALRAYLLGPDRSYDVRDDGDGCFDLEGVGRPHPLAPYGRRATLCFDAASEALVLVEIHHDHGVTERTTARVVGTEVGDDELQLPGSGG